MGPIALGTPTISLFGGQKSIAKHGFGGTATSSGVSLTRATTARALSRYVVRPTRPTSRFSAYAAQSRISGGRGSSVASREVARAARRSTRGRCSCKSAVCCPFSAVCFRQPTARLRQSLRPLAVSVSTAGGLRCLCGSGGRSSRSGSRISLCQSGCVCAPRPAGCAAISLCRLSRTEASSISCCTVAPAVCAATSPACISPSGGT